MSLLGIHYKVKKKNTLIDFFDIHWSFFLFKAMFDISGTGQYRYSRVKKSIQLDPVDRANSYLQTPEPIQGRIYIIQIQHKPSAGVK
jgi:hypothetical protein